jgi:hypothetical protein
LKKRVIETSAKKARKTKDGWAKYMREYRLIRPDVCKNIDLKKNFGIDLEFFNYLLKKQGYVCAICKMPETTLNRRHHNPQSLTVDHNHTTGVVRGLLCNNCNRAIGLLKDDTKILLAAVDYLGA